MTEILNHILDWVAQHTLWAGVVIFLVAMAESLAIVGLIVPGVVIMFGIGALIATGAIPFWVAVSWAVAGAVVGDGLSFWLGHHFKDRLRQSWPFNKHPESLDRGIAFFQRYGGKSVAFGRFFGPVRAVIPLVAGMMGMPATRFVIANVLSALVWAPAYLLPGMVFGASMELASEVAFRLVTILVVLALLIWFGLWLIKRIFQLLQPHSSAVIQWLLNWSQLHPKLGTIAAALADPAHPEAKALSILATLLILTTAFFVLISGAVLQGDILGLNQTVLSALQSLRTPWGDHLMVTFTRQTDTQTVILLAVGMLIFFVIENHRRTALYWLAAIAFASIAPWLLKMGLQIPRPEILNHPHNSYAFPSGHTLQAVVLYGFLSVIIAWSLPLKWRWLPYTLAGMVVLSVGLSRLYLGVHWLTDVLGSITLGLAWVAVLGIAYRRHSVPEASWRGPTFILVGLYLLAMISTSVLQHDKRMRYYTPEPEIVELNSSDWWEGNSNHLPTWRADTRAYRNHPLNIQYAGELDTLRQTLQKLGWQPAQTITWGNALRLLSTKLPLQQLPVLPQVHNGRHESLLLEKLGEDDSRQILRLWPANVSLQPEGTPLWIGNVSQQQREQLLGMITFAKTSAGFTVPFEQLTNQLTQNTELPISKENKTLLIREQP
ncbi:MAG: LssY C-terminal domain-containing protein [Chromatiales bacterium]|nr:LssY C-terminal domain-containing protein [Chromatiales bacterium]